MKTGDIEDYPCVDGIHTFPTRINNGKVFVTIDEKKVSNHKRAPKMGKKTDDPRTFIILGGGPAGLTAAETLRQEGFGGRVIMICKEKHLPYDRPKLSKNMSSTAESILLRPAQFFIDNNIETKMQVEVSLYF